MEVGDISSCPGWQLGKREEGGGRGDLSEAVPAWSRKERKKEHPLFAPPTFSILSDAHGRALFTCAQEKKK